MELKVWVDGIQRVICGVSPSTTCQDIVLALAHATGRTGRFTLIEKWRNNERPLAPVEQPLQVLQKWGEYATDVQFMLIQNDKTGLKTPSKSNTPPDKKDRFTHNFTPPHTQGDAHIKRSFTFSGAHSGNSVTSPNRLKERFRDREAFHESSISEESELGSSSTASPVSSSSKPSLPLRSVNHRLPGAPHVSSTISHNSPSNSLERSAQRKPPHRSAQSRPSSNGQVTRSNARPIPKPRVHRGNVSTTNGPKSLDDLYLSQNSPPDFQEARSSSPLPEFEEYDLDKNFPVTSKSAPSRVRGRSSQPRKAETSSSDESQEYSSLVRLVGIQQERLQLQESQISVVESEIQQLEERGKKDEERLQELEVEIRMWESKHGACERELLEIDSSRCQDQLDSEKQSEQILKSHIDSLRAKITESEKELSDMNSKKDSIIKEIESVQKDISEQENRDKESEVKLTQETAETQKEIDTKLVHHKEDKDKLEELTKEVKVLDTTVQEKKDQILELENSLKEANLQQFVITPPGTPTLKGNNSEEGESAVFKQLSRPPGIRKHAVSPQDFSSTVSSTENPDGVWV